ncbi:MAG: hypothetical protein IPF93_08550 [Saprospiraceae bacterium]|nr:hypothetical protein [Saprospiraceae bacterium]
MYRPHRSSIKYLAILSVVPVGTSCERILDKDPIGILDADHFFKPNRMRSRPSMQPISH